MYIDLFVGVCIKCALMVAIEFRSMCKLKLIQRLNKVWNSLFNREGLVKTTNVLRIEYLVVLNKTDCLFITIAMDDYSLSASYAYYVLT